MQELANEAAIQAALCSLLLSSPAARTSQHCDILADMNSPLLLVGTSSSALEGDVQTTMELQPTTNCAPASDRYVMS